MFDTIVAPATALVPSALGLVRIDGPDAPRFAEILAGRELTERVATHVRLTHAGEPLDDAVVTVFRAPRSFTGNDSAELTLHGSPFLLRRVTEAVVALGGRIAEPGEFTERAVLNGKLDLVQAEAVLQLIESRTELQARLSLTQLDGELSRSAAAIRDALLFVISRLEAALDFAEEGYEFLSRADASERLEEVARSLRQMLATYERGRAVIEGVTAVILGRPNAGKSTLLNFLVGSDRAIVTDLPGTTRDLLRETVQIGGIPVTFVDTAGLRETEDVVEGIGISRARAAAAGADLVLYLVDGEKGLTRADEDEVSCFPDAIVVYTKADRSRPKDRLAISVPAQIGLDELLRILDARVRHRWTGDSGAALVNQRQQASVAGALEAIESASAALGNMLSEELVLVDLYRAMERLSALTGAITHGEIMTEIFSKFCIGK